MTTETLSSKRKEAFSWAECMDKSGNSIGEILEDLQDKIEKQDKDFIRKLKFHFRAPKGKFGSSINEYIDKLAGEKLI